MKFDVRMSRQPFVIAFVNTIIVENNMNFFLITAGQLQEHLIHERQKLYSPFKLRGQSVDGTRGYVQRCKKIQGAVPLIGTLEAADNFAVAGADIASSSLQCLNASTEITRALSGGAR